MKKQEDVCAKIALDVVAENGGKITFEQYDAVMYPKKYFTPIQMCAFSACEVGLIEQTNEGYKIK